MRGLIIFCLAVAALPLSVLGQSTESGSNRDHSALGDGCGSGKESQLQSQYVPVPASGMSVDNRGLSALVAGSVDDGGKEWQTQFNITPYVPESVTGMSANNRELLLSRLNTVLSRTGMLSQLGESRFVLTATVSVVDKEVVNTSPAQIVCKYELSVGIGDGMDGTLYASALISVKGVGKTEEKALANALKQVSPGNEAIAEMLKKGCGRIIDYYDRNAKALMAKADAMCVDGNFEEAIYLMSTIPMGCGYFDESVKKLSTIYQRYSDFNCSRLLSDASAAWAANPTAENAEAVVEKLSGISPNAANYKQVEAFIKKVQGSVESEIEYERNKERTALERENQLEQQRINASRDVALAYAASLSKMEYKILR